MKIHLSFMLIGMLVISCEPNENNPKYPECYQDGVELALSVPLIPSDRANIRKYNVESEIYNGIVYSAEFLIGGYDVGGGYTTSECEPICGTNGLTGQSNCPSDFLENLEFIETVWEDPR